MELSKKYWLVGLIILVVLVGAVVASKHVKKLASDTTESTVQDNQVVSMPVNSPVSATQHEKIKGPATAPITIIEFSDLQCPSCKMAQKPLWEIFDKFPNLIQVHFKHFPLPMHHYSGMAARFAECAVEQNQFWEYSELLYEEQDTWSKDPDALALFFAYANSLKLDTPKLQACLQNPQIAQMITAEQNEGRAMQINSTPTFFINGDRVVGAKQLSETGEKVIKQKLEALAGHKNS